MKKLFTAFLLLSVALVVFAAPVKVIVWYAQTGVYSQTLLELIDEFNRLNEGKIVVEGVYSGSYEDTMQKLVAAMVAGNMPHIAQIEQSRIGQFLDGDVFQNLDEFINKDSAFKATLSDFFPRFIAANTFNNKLYGFPLNTSTPLMYVNRDVFRAAGLDPDNPPRTWMEVYQASKVIKALGDDFYGYRLGDDDWILESYSWQFGGDIVSEDGMEILLNSPETISAWKFFQKGLREGVFVYSRTNGNAMDLSGKIAMVCRSTGSLAYLKENAKFDLGATFMPYQVKKATPIGGANIYMFRNKPQTEKQAAWEFMKFVTSTPSTKKWALATGYMASRISAYQSPEIQELFINDPRAEITYLQLQESAVRRPYIGPYREIFNIMISGWQTIMTDMNADVEAVLKSVAEKAQKVLNEY
jgi:sn-glycerol 3-phosphate transport system substrate-binding protein